MMIHWTPHNYKLSDLKKNLKEFNLKELKNISKNMNINHDNNIKKKKLYELVYNHIKEQNK